MGQPARVGPVVPVTSPSREEAILHRQETRARRITQRTQLAGCVGIHRRDRNTGDGAPRRARRMSISVSISYPVAVRGRSPQPVRVDEPEPGLRVADLSSDEPRQRAASDDIGIVAGSRHPPARELPLADDDADAVRAAATSAGTSPGRCWPSPSMKSTCVHPCASTAVSPARIAGAFAAVHSLAEHFGASAGCFVRGCIARAIIHHDDAGDGAGDATNNGCNPRFLVERWNDRPDPQVSHRGAGVIRTCDGGSGGLVTGINCERRCPRSLPARRHGGRSRTRLREAAHSAGRPRARRSSTRRSQSPSSSGA